MFVLKRTRNFTNGNLFAFMSSFIKRFTEISEIVHLLIYSFDTENLVNYWFRLLSFLEYIQSFTTLHYHS